MNKGREGGDSDPPINRDPLRRGLRCNRGQYHIHTAPFVFPLFPQTKRKFKTAGKLTELLVLIHFYAIFMGKGGVRSTSKFRRGEGI